MEVVRRQLGKAAPVAPPPPKMPVGGEIAWRAFAELSRTRGHNGFGFLPIQWGEIYAWQRVTRIALAPWEVNAITELDEAYLESKAKELDNRGK